MKTLTIVIPVYNEADRLQKTFEALTSLSLPSGLTLFEVIFVNDGSTDNTLGLIKSFAKTHKKLPISLISYASNRGKGYAVKKGMLASIADYTLLCDADMSTPFSELAKFMPHINKNLSIIIGTRKNGKSTVVVHQPKVREVLGKGFTYLTRVILQLQITDFTCGFKLFSKNAIATIFPRAVIERWGYDAETLYIAQKNALPMVECPVLWANDQRSHVRIFVAIPQTILEMGKILFTHNIWPHAESFSTLYYEKAQRIFSFYR